jgi:RNA polymerase sigma factor (sigma-70 family)
MTASPQHSLGVPVPGTLASAPPDSAPAGPLADAAVIRLSWHEPEAFAELYDRHAAEIHRYATRRLGATAADDIVADTFLAAFRSRQRYDLSRADSRPWLFGIAANMIGKQRRAEVRMLRALARTGIDPADSGHAELVESRVSAAAVHQQLAAAVAGLSAGDREVLLLFAWAELSYDGIAEALAIPVGTVRSRLHRARRKTREALRQHDPATLMEGLPHE